VETLHGEHAAGELIERCVFAELAVDPASHCDGALGGHGVFIKLQQVGPALGPEVGVGGALQEAIDELAAFVG
jgi:hypothetical protein